MVWLLKSFFFNGFVFECPSNVYFPSEESYLLASSISECRNAFALDLGCGSGVQTINLLQKGAKKVVAVDINKDCLSITFENCKKADFGDSVELRLSDLFSKVNEKFDLIVFNPPYVPTKSVKFVDLDGGIKGRVLLDRFLDEVSTYLCKHGVAYFLQTNLNGFRESESKLESFGFSYKVVSEKKLFFETLRVYCCSRNTIFEK